MGALSRYRLYHEVMVNQTTACLPEDLADAAEAVACVKGTEVERMEHDPWLGYSQKETRQVVRDDPERVGKDRCSHEEQSSPNQGDAGSACASVVRLCIPEAPKNGYCQ